MVKVRPVPQPALPPLYAAWADQFLEEPIPAETEATCGDCAMCAAGQERSSPDALYFDPRVKCCSYVPVLPNFLVGRILADDRDESRGRAAIEARLDAGVAVTPFGIGRAPALDLLYEKHGDALFGRARSLRCPHYEDENGGRCGIWRHREAVCATFFCKYVRGAVGRRFWRTLARLLGAVERDLSLWCALELGVDSEALRELCTNARPEPTPGDVDGVTDDEQRRKIWGIWLGRERPFFRKSAALVERMRWTDIEALSGPHVKALTRLTREAFAALRSRELPRTLSVGRFETLGVSAASSVVAGYCATDALELPNALLTTLHHFDGSRSTAQALRTIRAENGVTIEPGLLRTLVAFEILVANRRGSTNKKEVSR